MREGVSDRWTDHLIHFIDFEGSLASGILEYGVVTLRGTEVVDVATRLCRATGRIRDEDVAVHGLDAAAVAGCAPFADEFERFVGLRSKGPLAAHFASVENTLLKSVWPYPRTSPNFAHSGGSITEWGPWVDPGRIYPQLYPTLPTAKLESLVGSFGLQVPLDEAASRWCPAGRRRYHAALYDALAGALLLARLAQEPAVANQSFMWLLTMSTLDPTKRDALNQGELF